MSKQSNLVNASQDITVDADGNVGIGVTPTSLLHIKGQAPVLTLQDIDTAGITNIEFQDSAATVDAKISVGNGTQYMAFETAGSEAMRIDASGNLLVGTTDNTLYNNNAGGNTGVLLRGLVGNIQAARSDGAPLDLNRLDANGDIAVFAKDGFTVGSIGSRNGEDGYLSLNSVGLTGSSTGGGSLLPTTGGTTYVDNVVDLGFASGRFDNIFATNGSIQTSDQNEKQQIASMTDAEITAAKAISKLFKTFKWNDSVAEKGDAARTHTGVIAQEVEQAMTDAGLDAGDYAFWCSDTWWEADGETYDTAEEAPEGATERNRKGIRYPQLLSFIGAATEQRLASIESRLDALETN